MAIDCFITKNIHYLPSLTFFKMRKRGLLVTTLFFFIVAYLGASYSLDGNSSSVIRTNKVLKTWLRTDPRKSIEKLQGQELIAGYQTPHPYDNNAYYTSFPSYGCEYAPDVEYYLIEFDDFGDSEPYPPGQTETERSYDFFRVHECHTDHVLYVSSGTVWNTVTVKTDQGILKQITPL